MKKNAGLLIAVGILLVIAASAIFSGCGKNQAPPEADIVTDTDTEEEKEQRDLIPMVMVDGVLYLDTGYNSTVIQKCGTPDGKIISAVDGNEEPSADDQSNFGTGYEYQYGTAEGTVELYINGKWRIFATEEAREKIQFPETQTGAEIYIVDIWDRAAEEGLPCDEALEKFYEDEANEYYFSCIKSHYVMVLDSTGRTVDIVTALNEGLATIADLDHFGIEYYTEPKQ